MEPCHPAKSSGGGGCGDDGSGSRGACIEPCHPAKQLGSGVRGWWWWQQAVVAMGGGSSGGRHQNCAQNQHQGHQSCAQNDPSQRSWFAGGGTVSWLLCSGVGRRREGVENKKCHYVVRVVVASQITRARAEFHSSSDFGAPWSSEVHTDCTYLHVCTWS